MTAADSAVQPQTRQALRWFGRVTDGQYQDALDGTTVRRQVDTDPHFDERRSFARSAEKEVVISVESPRPQIVNTLAFQRGNGVSYVVSALGSNRAARPPHVAHGERGGLADP